MASDFAQFLKQGNPLRAALIRLARETRTLPSVLIWGDEATLDRQPWHLAFDLQIFLPTWKAEDEEARQLQEELKLKRNRSRR